MLVKGPQVSQCHNMRDIGNFNTLRQRQNGRHFADDILKCIFLNENIWISIKISLKFVPKGPINNIPPLVRIMAWHRSGDKPLSEPIVVSLLKHICVTRPQWVNQYVTVYCHTKVQGHLTWYDIIRFLAFKSLRLMLLMQLKWIPMTDIFMGMNLMKIRCVIEVLWYMLVLVVYNAGASAEQ